jgi:DNA-binding IclR family transcriptional regulator
MKTSGRFITKKALIQLPAQSISTADALINEIEKVRINKVAIDDEECMGGYCIAAPLPNPKGECVAAISISTPKNRLNASRCAAFAKLVSETAGKISGSLSAP